MTGILHLLPGLKPFATTRPWRFFKRTLGIMPQQTPEQPSSEVNFSENPQKEEETFNFPK